MNHRRTGKIARLPEEVRNQVNDLIANGAEYSHILDHLTQQGFQGFSAQNISNWKEGGFQDWLKHRDRLEELSIKTAFAIELASSGDSSAFQQATLNLSTVQFFELLNRFDSTALTRALEDKPEKFPALINSFAKLTREVVGLERFRAEQHERAKREAENNPQNSGGISTETIQKCSLHFEFATRASSSWLPKPPRQLSPALRERDRKRGRHTSLRRTNQAKSNHCKPFKKNPESLDELHPCLPRIPWLKL